MDDLLGRADERYFGDVFRCFHMDVPYIEKLDGEAIHGHIQIGYIGPERPRSESPHLGSIEYLSLALRIASYGLNRLGSFSIADTNRAFLRNYRFNSSDMLGIGRHGFICRMLRCDRDMSSMQGSTSIFEIQIGNARIEIAVDHRGGSRYLHLPESETLAVDVEQLHSLGYKCTTLTIAPPKINLEMQQISTQINFKYQLPTNSLDGIGSSRDALLATDAIRIFGQLMQVLLYTREGSDRTQCSNIWLRKMDLRSQRPLFTGEAEAIVTFDKSREIRKGDSHWNLISLSGTVGNYEGKFEVAFEVKK